jgi:catechol 2,3-dioxygenase-like lactoylglutathione lyase family enzyme
MAFAQEQAISDICILVENIEATVAFYTEKLGFKLRRRAEGFADFSGVGLTLAAWELDHLNTHTGVSNARGPQGIHKTCIAVELKSPDLVDQYFNELHDKGVTFVKPPEDYLWNARCAYFSDPDGTVWELYAWLKGGPGDYHQIHDE